SEPEGSLSLTVAAPSVAGITAEAIRVTAAPLEGGDPGTIRIEGEAPGFRAAGGPDGGIAGERLAFRLDGRLAEGGPALRDAALSLGPLDASFTGRADPRAVDGDLTIKAADLSALSGILDRPLSGSVDLEAKISGDP